MWLFTYSDLKTIVGPTTVFGVCSSLCAETFDISPRPMRLVVQRIPLVLLWTWINLLPFAIANQRHPSAIQEDGINKPWRPMPTARLSEPQARRWMLVLYLIAFIYSIFFGGIRQYGLLAVLGFYNDLHGADSHPLIRNLINACGFICYTSGAMEVAYGNWINLTIDSLRGRWLAIIGAVVASSVHTQDMYDQAGDSISGRNTLPLVIGDWPARLSIAVVVPLWSCCGLWFWQSDGLSCFPVLSLGAAVALRTVTVRTVSGDKMTFKLWNAWLVALYMLPLITAIYRHSNQF